MLSKEEMRELFEEYFGKISQKIDDNTAKTVQMTQELSKTITDIDNEAVLVNRALESQVRFMELRDEQKRFAP